MMEISSPTKTTITASTETSATPLVVLNEMRQKGDCCDGILRTEDGGEFKIHRTIMLAASSYFYALYNNQLNTDDRTDILVPGVKGAILTKIIDFIYTQKVEVTEVDVWELIVAADQFNLVKLVDRCYEHLTSNLTLEYCILLYRFTKMYGLTDLEQKVKRFVASNFTKIPEDNEYLWDLPSDYLCDLLKDDKINAKEEFIWFVIQRWIDRDPEERKCYVPNLLASIRIMYLNRNFLFEEIMQHPAISSNEECKDILMERFRILLNISRMSSSTKMSTPLIARPRIPSDLLFVLGGYSKVSNTTGIIEVYDHKADIWSKLEEDLSCQYARRAGHVCLALGTSLYVIGGEDKKGGRVHSSVSCLDLEHRRWYLVPPMKQARCGFCAVVIRGCIYVIGGFQQNSKVLHTVEKFSSRSNMWSYVDSLRTNRCFAGAAVLEGRIYVVGGSTNKVDHMRSVEAYDTETCSWSNVTAMNEPRSRLSAAEFKGHIYVAGGKSLTSVERFEPNSGVWTFISSMNEPRNFFSLVVLDDDLYAIGGVKTHKDPENDDICGSEVLDAASNTWRSITSSEYNLAYRGACVISGLSNVEDYVLEDRGQLLELKRKQVVELREKREERKARDCLKMFNL